MEPANGLGPWYCTACTSIVLIANFLRLFKRPAHQYMGCSARLGSDYDSLVFPPLTYRQGGFGKCLFMKGPSFSLHLVAAFRNSPPSFTDLVTLASRRTEVHHDGYVYSSITPCYGNYDVLRSVFPCIVIGRREPVTAGPVLPKDFSPSSNGIHHGLTSRRHI
ncbi:hypothetical protein F5146DRAFT_1065989 [Armillaria mellea]|nr:hypothetical protein F5146DRAFT_1065989 [Armillaria mellea]